MSDFGKVLMTVGGLLFIVGLLVIIFGKFSGLGLGRLPGDLLIKKENFTLFIPITTCLLLSLIISLILLIWNHK